MTDEQLTAYMQTVTAALADEPARPLPGGLQTCNCTCHDVIGTPAAPGDSRPHTCVHCRRMASGPIR